MNYQQEPWSKFSSTSFNSFNESLRCIVCSKQDVCVRPNQSILQDYTSRLIICKHCQHQWFENPSQWRAEAYTAPIANTDTGIVERSRYVHRIISSFLSFVGCHNQILDWGSGSGLLVRLLRDDGYDCYGLEPYTNPSLAGSHTWQDEQVALVNGPFRAVTAIEVIEHLDDPRAFFQKIFSITDTLIFSTELVDPNRNRDDWWYYSRETGQHISFYSQKSLSHLASLHGCLYGSARSKGLHIVSKKISDLLLFMWIAGSRRSKFVYPVAQLLSKVTGRCSLSMLDHAAAKAALLADSQSIRAL